MLGGSLFISLDDFDLVVSLSETSSNPRCKGKDVWYKLQGTRYVFGPIHSGAATIPVFSSSADSKYRNQMPICCLLFSMRTPVARFPRNLNDIKTRESEREDSMCLVSDKGPVERTWLQRP
jgi:hypothetical protein